MLEHTNHLLKSLAASASLDIQTLYSIYVNHCKYNNDNPITQKDFSDIIQKNQEDILESLNYSDGNVSLVKDNLKNQGVEAFMFGTSDEYQNEYVPDYAKRLQFLTGFTGSLGLCIITQKKCVLFVDGRYTLQASYQVNTELFDICNYTKEDISQWIQNNLSDINQITFNSKVISIKEYLAYEKIIKPLGKEITLIDNNLVDEVWRTQPQKPIAPIIEHQESLAGKSSESKINDFVKFMDKEDIDGFFITDLASICWLLNIRGSDVKCNPFVISQCFIDKNHNIHLFTHGSRYFNHNVKNVFIQESSKLEEFLNNFKGKVGISFESSVYFHNLLKNKVLIESPILLWKACKNAVEVENTKKAHFQEGLAIIKMMYELFNNTEEYTELSISKKLHELRQESPNYKGESFPSIVGVDSNGAIIHYRSTKETCKPLKSNSYLLLDTGAQYLNGTTDMTRSFCFANNNEEYKKHYTFVLKALISLSSHEFKEGTTGKQLDEVSRSVVQSAGYNYPHGTGHGVGVYLGVHEGPASISPLSEVPVREGMIFSNEPGWYVENHYGIRLENLIVTKKNNDRLYFETITHIPFDTNSINISILSDSEKAWVTNYHKSVYNIYNSFLKDNEKKWLSSYLNI